MQPSLTFFAEEEREMRELLVKALNQSEKNEFEYHWDLIARPSQLAPTGAWRTWMILAGRGFGKTRSGAEWVRKIAESNADARIALVASSLAEARSIMVEGESGIIACSPPERRPIFEASLRRLRFPNGALAFLYSAGEPENLRGPEHSHAWCDEIGKWPQSSRRAMRCWDNLQLGLRVGQRPQAIVTTTPRTVPLVERLLLGDSDGSVAVTRGSTYENVGNLPDPFFEAIEAEYANTQLGRQEIDGAYLRDIEGALWNRSTLETIRDPDTPVEYTRVVVAVDPPISASGDECGIIVAALGADGMGYILADCSVSNATPSGWANAVDVAAHEWGADRVVAEANQGGEMVEAVLRAANQGLPIKLVRASRGKTARAEPIAALYEVGRVVHRTVFAKLEDQLCGLMTGGQYAGPGRSPDRADALVWALSELMLSNSPNPSVRSI